MKRKRLDHEPPEAIVSWGWKYHHTGIPTDRILPGEQYLPQYKFYVTGFDTSPFGIEWMRFEKDSPINSLVQNLPHLAFEVDDIEKELAAHDLRVMEEPGKPSEGVRVAMIEYEGTPIELIEFQKNKIK